MAAPKAWHVKVTDGWKTIEDKTFFKTGDANKYFKEMKEKYPNFMVTRENY